MILLRKIINDPEQEVLKILRESLDRADVRKYDLTTKFKHIYKNTKNDENTTTTKKSLKYRQALNEKNVHDWQLAKRQGEDVRVSNAQLKTSVTEAEHATPQDSE